MAMERKDELIEVLRDRFAGHEVAVPPAAWDAITSQLALGAATSTDLVSDLLRERFSGHEAEVDPGVWEAIEQQVARPDPVNSLLRERFNGHEMPVPSAAWTAIEGQLGHGAAAGGSSLLGWVAVGPPPCWWPGDCTWPRTPPPPPMPNALPSHSRRR